MIASSTSTYDEFVEWYFRREVRKAAVRPDMKRTAEEASLKEGADVRRELMRKYHCGKFHPWFELVPWQVVQLEFAAELERLMIVSKSHWEGIEGPMPRFLGKAVEHLAAQRYFTKLDAPQHQLRTYYGQFIGGDLRLRGDDRVVLLTLRGNAEWPDGTIYVHDGCGRLLAYLSYLRDTGAEYDPVEAFHVVEP